MAGVSFSELQKVRLKRTPPPKVPLGTNSSQNGDLPSDSGCVSVSAFRNRFEQKQTPTTRAPEVGSSSRQDGGQPSVASTRAMFEQKSVKKPPVPWKQTNLTQSKVGQRRMDNNSNVLKGEPPRKVLPPAFRIGAAPDKKPKPAKLKFMLGKYKEKIILSNAANYVARTSNAEENEDIYDDVLSTLQGNQNNQAEELYECM